MFKRKDNQLHFQFDALKMILEPWGTDSLRIRAWEQHLMPDEDWALLNPEIVEPKITIGSSYAEIENGKIKAVVDHYGQLKFYNQHGKLILEEYNRNRRGYVGAMPLKITSEGQAVLLRLRQRSSDPSSVVITI